MQQSSATPKNQGIGLQKIVACSHSSLQCLLVSGFEACCMLSLLLAVPSCIYSFGMVSSLHPTSFLMIFVLVSLIIILYPGLVARGVYVCSIVVRATRSTLRIYARIKTEVVMCTRAINDKMASV